MSTPLVLAIVALATAAIAFCGLVVSAALARVSARARAQSPAPEQGYAIFGGIRVVVDETVERGMLELRFGCTQSRHFVGDQATSCECGALLVEDLGDGCAVSLVGISVQPHTLSEPELARG